jgi:hypothetical protein
MPKATLEEVKTAIETADERFAEYQKGEGTANMNGESVPIMFRIDGQRWDYGHPAICEMDKADIDELTQWWKARHPNSGRVLQREYKRTVECHEVNVQWDGESGRMFNYHVSVT